MIRFKYILLTFSAIFLFSCDDTLRNLNTDPEILENTQPEYLFAGATNNFMSPNRHHLTERFAGVMTFMQYLVSTGGSGGGAYIPQDKKDGATPRLSFFWDDYYKSTGNNFRILMRLIDQSDRKNEYQGLRAITQMLEIQQAWICLDLYGAMPYHEALKAITEGGTQKPKYDFIWDLYKYFDETVKKQVEILEGLTEESKQADIAKYDYFYKGDLNRWAKFGNSLRIKMALRYENRDPDFLKQVVGEVTNTRSGVMVSDEDGCWYHHPKDFNDNIDDINAIRKVYETTEAFVNTLKYTGDPRLYIMIRKNHFEPGYRDYEDMLVHAPDSLLKYNPANERYLGMPASPYAVNNGATEYGVRIKENIDASWKGEDENDISRSVRLISQLQGRFFVKNGGYKSGEEDPLKETWVDNQSIKMSTCVLSYADICFTMAEIAEKYGLTPYGSAADWYKKGIESSIRVYVSLAKDAKVPDADIKKCEDATAAYLSSAVVQYTGSRTEKLEKIYSQAWINYLKHPEEAYAMWKRTGYPQFKDWNPGQPVTVGYLDKLYGADSKSDASVLLIPRRHSIPQRDENYANWDAAVRGQMSKDAAYGQTIDDSRGRIWWDNK